MLYSCKPILERVKANVTEDLRALNLTPKAAILVTGNDEPSARYVRNKVRDFSEVGIDYEIINTMSDKGYASLDDIADIIRTLNADYRVHGIIIQRPVYTLEYSTQTSALVLNRLIRFDKDIDGVTEQSGFLPPSVKGLELLLDEWKIDPAGRSVTVIGRGDVGRPVAEYLLKRDATVTICHSKTDPLDRDNAIYNSDIVIGAAGLAQPIYPFCRIGGVVIDYGIRPGADGKLHGDFVTEDNDYLQYQTSVPGGMGLMVRAGLLLNIRDAAIRQVVIHDEE